MPLSGIFVPHVDRWRQRGVCNIVGAYSNTHGRCAACILRLGSIWYTPTNQGQNTIYNNLTISNINRSSAYTFRNLALTASEAMPATWGKRMPPRIPQPRNGCMAREQRNFASCTILVYKIHFHQIFFGRNWRFPPNFHRLSSQSSRRCITFGESVCSIRP